MEKGILLFFLIASTTALEAQKNKIKINLKNGKEILGYGYVDNSGVFLGQTSKSRRIKFKLENIVEATEDDGE